MKARNNAGNETPEQAAESISAALDFLQGEAEAAGLTEVSGLIQQASAKARDGSPSAPDQDLPLPEVCRAISRLPEEYRKALIFKKVYRYSYEEIAADCSVSVATAKDRVLKGFKLVRTSLQIRPA